MGSWLINVSGKSGEGWVVKGHIRVMGGFCHQNDSLKRKQEMKLEIKG